MKFIGINTDGCKVLGMFCFPFFDVQCDVDSQGKHISAKAGSVLQRPGEGWSRGPRRGPERKQHPGGAEHQVQSPVSMEVKASPALCTSVSCKTVTE